MILNLALILTVLTVFTGVVVAFGRPMDASGSRIRRHAFLGLLAASLQALLFSLAPFLLAAVGMTEPTIWRVGSAGILVGQVLGAIGDLRFSGRTAQTEWTRFDRVVQGVTGVLGVGSLKTENVAPHRDAGGMRAGLTCCRHI